MAQPYDAGRQDSHRLAEALVRSHDPQHQRIRTWGIAPEGNVARATVDASGECGKMKLAAVRY